MAKDPAFLFKEKEWNTPNTYDTNGKFPPEASGVYLLILRNLNWKAKRLTYKILYVGSSKSLLQRYSRHEVMRILQEIYDAPFKNIVFYFRECENYKQEEKRLIKLIQPRFNKQWR